MLVSRHKATVDRLFRPLAIPLAKAGVSPTAITLTTPLLATGVCWWLTRTREVAPFCFLKQAYRATG